MFEAHSCGILSSIHEQSADINQGVERARKEQQGAGDQGMMFGYASNETDNYMPLALDLAHRILQELAQIRKEGRQMTYLRPDSQIQVTVEYGADNNLNPIETFVDTTQHDEHELQRVKAKAAMNKAQPETQARLRAYIISLLLPRVQKQVTLGLGKLLTAKIK